jgi:hypothetical protein
MAKKQLTAEQVYKRNQKISKLLRVLSPVVFWVCLGLSILCFVFALKNSFGNVAEICDQLDSQKWSGEQIATNYFALIEKYGEWVIGNGSSGFTLTFVNIGNALFSGLMITNFTFAVLFLATAYLLGKWLLPKISAQILIDNQDMVNLVILKNNK